MGKVRAVILVVALLIGFCWSSVVFAGEPVSAAPSVSVQDATCAVSGETSIDVSFNDPSGAVDALVFSLDISEGITATNVIAHGNHMVFFDPLDNDGEVDYAMWQLPSDPPIQSGVVATVEIECGQAGEFTVDFSTDPPPSFGADGYSVPGNLEPATVTVQAGPTAVTLVEFQGTPINPIERFIVYLASLFAH